MWLSGDINQIFEREYFSRGGNFGNKFVCQISLKNVRTQKIFSVNFFGRIFFGYLFFYVAK